MLVRSLGREDPLEKEMATHSSILAWEIPWTEEPVRLRVHGVARVGHELGTKLQQGRSHEEIRDEPRGWGHRPNAPDSPVRS